jgi:YD repeat-containing protein
MAKTLVAVVAVALATLAMASHVRAYAEPQTRTFYNDRGQETGRATTRGNATNLYNEKGQEVGRSERRGNTTNFYNERGQIIGTSRERR